MEKKSYISEIKGVINKYSLHHGGRDGAAVLDGCERGREVGRVRRFNHLLVPVHHIQVPVKLLTDLFR